MQHAVQTTLDASVDSVGIRNPDLGREPMSITVFGATGGIGGHLVRQALAAGANVTAVVRSSTRFEARHPALRVETVPGLTEPGALLAALEASDAAISGVGPRGRKDGGVAASTTRGILS